MNQIVLFTQRVFIKAEYGERWDCADQRIEAFLRSCGLVPVPVPNDTEILTDYFSMLQPSGIVLTGGNSLVKYGGDAPERDVMDEACIRLAIEHRIPVYGFCRGMQSILDYFEETLSNVVGHVAVRHAVTGKIRREVNSYHGQACMQLQTDHFEVLGKGEDGTIEAVRHRHYPIVGTMWHPERETSFQEEDIQMVRDLFTNKQGEDSL